MDAPPVGDADSARNAPRAEFANAIEILRPRVEAEPGVTGVTFVDRLPTTNHPAGFIELDGARGSTGGGESTNRRPPLHVVSVAAIEPTYFDVLQAPILAGRAFRPADVAPNSQVAIVDQGFVDQILEGRNPIGQRVRFVNRSAGADQPPEPWLEVVGVVKELGMGAPVEVGRAAGFYLPGRPEFLDPTYMMVHVKGDPMALAPQLREMAAAVNPMLRLSEFQRLDEVNNPLLWIMGLWIKITVLMSAVALLLSLAGIYAVLSFTVSQRTREIGLRVAVGASRLQVVTAIFRRPLLQVGLGILAGGALIVAGGNIQTEMPGLTGELSLKQYGIIVAYATFMLAVCLLACVVPTRRALGVEPTIALRAD